MKLNDQKIKAINIYKATNSMHIWYKALGQVEQSPKMFMPYPWNLGRHYILWKKNFAGMT